MFDITFPSFTSLPPLLVLSHYTPKGGGKAAQWLSGVGKDKLGPCDSKQLLNSKCSEVVFSDFLFKRGPGTPTNAPTMQGTPSRSPTHNPTHSPSELPSVFPSISPTHYISEAPSMLDHGYCCFWMTATWDPCYCTTKAKKENWCNLNNENCESCRQDPQTGHDRIGWCTVRETSSSLLNTVMTSLSIQSPHLLSSIQNLTNTQWQFIGAFLFFSFFLIIFMKRRSSQVMNRLKQCLRKH